MLFTLCLLDGIHVATSIVPIKNYRLKRPDTGSAARSIIQILWGERGRVFSSTNYSTQLAFPL